MENLCSLFGFGMLFVTGKLIWRLVWNKCHARNPCT